MCIFRERETNKIQGVGYQLIHMNLANLVLANYAQRLIKHEETTKWEGVGTVPSSAFVNKQSYFYAKCHSIPPLECTAPLSITVQRHPLLSCFSLCATPGSCRMQWRSSVIASFFRTLDSPLACVGRAVLDLRTSSTLARRSVSECFPLITCHSGGIYSRFNIELSFAISLTATPV